ncbi:ferrous iron transport protein A [candidate division WOR-3 bacterium]|nr:ferrous iron transport protein A [candidate division WOR-3 bacterium]
MKIEKGKSIPLSLAKSGENLIICELKGGGVFKEKCISMGIIPGKEIVISHKSRNGPCLMKIGDSRIIIGGGMMNKIFVVEP